LNKLYLLFTRDLLLWRNSYWRTSKQAAATMAVATLIFFVAWLVARAALRWFSPIAAAVQGGIGADLLTPLLAQLLIWLLVLDFFTAAQQSREQFFLTPDLTLLIAAPVNPKLILAQRFLFLTCLTPAAFFGTTVFGLAPLAALGMLAAAPWFYYMLLLPLLYLFRLLSAALAIAMLMLLLRLVPVRRLYQALAVGNFLFGALSFLFLRGGQQALWHGGTALSAGWGQMLWIFPPLASLRDLLLALMGGGGSLWFSFVILIASSLAVMALVLLVAERLYFLSYDRLQSAETRPPQKASPRKNTAGTASYAPVSLFWFLVVEQWKMAVRNREMLPSAVFFIALLPVYIAITGYFAGGSPPWLIPANAVVVSLCAILAVLLLFLPSAMATDRLAVNRLYWPQKVAPIRDAVLVGVLYMAHCLPALALTLIFFFPVSYFTGLAANLLLPSAGLTVLLVISGVALYQFTMLQEIATAGEELPLLSRVAREAAILYGPIYVLPSAIALYYREIGFLSFLHGWPHSAVLALGIAFSAALALSALVWSLRRMAAAWQAMEIK